MFLCFDLGTTAVKAAVVAFDVAPSKATLQGCVSVDTHAYKNSDESPTHRAQDVRRILNAVNAATEHVLAAVGAMRADIADIAICDQMHGVLSWHMRERTHTHPQAAGAASSDAGSAASDAVSVTYSDLVTWEDARCDAPLLGRLNAIAGRYGLGHTHNGYGCATLAWALREGRHGSEAGTGRDIVVSGDAAVGTIGAFLACACTRTAGSQLDATDAASWGMFYLGQTTAARAGRAPEATTPGTESSETDGGGEGGWHMAALGEVHPALPGLMPSITSSGSCIGMLDPAACSALGLSALAELALTNRIRVHGSIGDHPAALIGTAHLTGVHIVPRFGASLDVFINIGTSAQAAVVISRQELSKIRAVPLGCEVRPFPNLRESNSETLRLLVGASMNGGNVLAAVATVVVGWYTSVATFVGASQASNASSELMTAVYAMLERDSSTVDAAVGSGSEVHFEGCLFPERVPVTLDAPAVVHSGVAVTRLTADALRQPHVLYAAAAAAVARNVISMLPSDVWTRCGRVVFSGGALAKSNTLRRAVRAQLFQACGREVAVVESPETASAAAFAGALGAAVVATGAD